MKYQTNLKIYDLQRNYFSDGLDKKRS